MLLLGASKPGAALNEAFSAELCEELSELSAGAGPFRLEKLFERDESAEAFWLPGNLGGCGAAYEESGVGEGAGMLVCFRNCAWLSELLSRLGGRGEGADECEC